MPGVTQPERPNYLWTPVWAGTPGRSSFPRQEEGGRVGRAQSWGGGGGWDPIQAGSDGGLWRARVFREEMRSGWRGVTPCSAQEEVKSGIDGAWDEESPFSLQYP